MAPEGYTPVKLVPLFIPLLCIACRPMRPASSAVTRRSQVDGPTQRYLSFYQTHETINCRVTVIRGDAKAGSGWLELVHRNRTQKPKESDISAAFYLAGPNGRYSFVHNRGISLEKYLDDRIYDRLTNIDVALPEARRFEGDSSFPAELIYGSAGPGFGPKNTIQTKDLGSGQTEYTSTYETPHGSADSRVVLGADGSLLALEGRRTGDKPWNGFEFSDYTFAPDPSQTFDTRPPVGYQQFGFDHAPMVVGITDPLPDIPVVSNGKKVRLRSLVAQPWALLVIVDGQVPSGLLAALKKIPKPVKVLILTHSPLQGRVPYPHAAASNKGLDDIGTAVFPQMYLLKSGKVDQAWEGWAKGQEKEFISQMKSVMHGKHFQST